MHAISVYLVGQEDLREDKLNSILDNKEIEDGGVRFIHLGEGIYATTKIPNSKEWIKGKLICEIETDYFGGFGEQSAKLYRDNEILMNGTDNDPINQALKMMGVKAKPGMDEFDTINLGNFRTNKDFEK